MEIEEKDLKDILKRIIREESDEPEYTVSGFSSADGIVHFRLDIDQVERDTSSILATDDVRSILCEEEECRETYAIRGEGAYHSDPDKDENEEPDPDMFFAFNGWHTMGEYCDDETDASLGCDMWIGTALDAKNIRRRVQEAWDRNLTASGVEKIKKAVELLGDVGTIALTEEEWKTIHGFSRMALASA